MQSGSLDLDVAVVRVTGTVTLDGATLPTASYRLPRIELRGGDGSTGTLVDLARASTGSYDTRLIPGTYDVLYTDDATGCTGDPYPCQQGVVIRSRVTIGGAGALDLDLRTIRVSGRITLDGVAPPIAGYRLPVIELGGVDHSTGVLVDLGVRPTGVYDVRLLAGTYDVLYSESSTSCTGSPYPCQVRAPIRLGQLLQSSGSLDLDVATVGVSGRVTVDGAALPAATYARPRIALGGADGKSTGLLVDLALHADGQYQARVLAGRYDVLYVESSALCTGTPFPCQQGVVVRAGVPLSGSGALDLDIATVLVTGHVTLDGAVPPPAGSSSPVIEIDGAGSSGVLVDIARAAGGAYQTRVIAGTYDVRYSASACGDARWPCQQQRVVKAGVRLTASGALDVDVRTAQVSGRVTLDKAPPPVSAPVLVTVSADDGSTGTLFDLQRHADGVYQARLLPGTYRMYYSQATCPVSPWPCMQQVALAGAVTIAADGALDVDVPTIQVSGRVTLAGAALPGASGPPRISLRDQRGTTGTLVDLARATSGDYQTRLVPGSYTMLYDAAAVCDGTVFPCQHARAVKGCEGGP